MKKTNKKGFTIVELVIVIAVIAILAAVLIPTFSNVVNKAKDSAALSAARNAYTELLAITNASPKSTTYTFSAEEASNKVNGANPTTGDPTQKEMQAVCLDTGVSTIVYNGTTYVVTLSSGYVLTYTVATSSWATTRPSNT
jgi:type IV pilus assembly protein PilA